MTDITDWKREELERRKFEMLANSSSEFIGMCDLDMHPLYVNPAGIRMVGLPDMAAACRVKVQDYFFPEDQRFIAEEFFPRVLREGHGDVEIRLRHFQTGEPIWMFYYLFSVRDATGKAVGWATVSRDITERKQAEALVNGQKQVLEMVASGAPLPEALTTLVRFIEAQAPKMLGSILLLDEDGIHVRHAAAPNLPPEYVAAVDGLLIGPCAGSCGTAAYRKEPVFVEDIATDPLWAAYKAVALPHGLRACWSTPIFDEQRRVLGTFTMYYRQPGLPQPEHRRLIDLATHTAAIAISRDQAAAALRRRDAILEAVGETAARLLGREDWRATVQETLGALGRAADTSRAYVFEFHRGADGALLASQRFEWVTAGVPPQMDNPDLQDFPMLASGFGRWVEALEKGDILAGHVREFPETEQAVLAPQGIRSILVVPIMTDDRLWGFLGFDECRAERVWSEPEIGALRVAARTLGAAIERQQTEEARRRSEERYRLLADNASDNIWVLSLADFRPTYVSPSSTRMFGFTPEESTHMDLAAQLPPESLELIQGVLAEELEKERDPNQSRNRSRVIELEQYIKGGGRLWTQMRTSFLRNDAGQPVAVLGITRDISEQKRAEAEARRTLARRQREAAVVAAIAASPRLAEGAVRELAVELTKAAARALETERVGVWLFEAGESRLVNVDNYFASSGEHSSGAVLLEPEFQNEFAALKTAKYVDAHDPLTDPRTAGYVAGYLKPNRITSMLDAVIRSGGRHLGALCFEHVDRPHHWEDDEITFACQLADQVALALAHRERRQAEQAQVESEERFRTLMQSIPGIAVQGYLADGTVVYWNKASEVIYGYAAAEAVGKSLADLIVPENLKPLFQECLATAKGVQVSGEFMPAGELLLLHKDGHQVPVYSIHTAVCIGGRAPVFFCVDVDLSERKRAEAVRAQLEAQLRQSQKLEAAGQLAGGVAHDFNNILAALMMNLDLLRQEAALPPELRAGLDEMAPLLQRAAALTRQLLLFARRGVMQRRVLDLNSLIGDLLKMLGRLIGEHIRLTFPGGQTSLWIHADSGMMEQVVTNLVVNARDAMPCGGQIELVAQRVEVDAAHVAAHPEARLGTFVCLAVHDTGSGMDEHTRQRIFEPFFTTKEVGKGTGLGLSTVQGIVQQHEGWIEVESVVGQGSTFRVYLPTVEPPQVAAATEALPESLPGGGETILVVEDEASVRAMTVRMLAQRGYRVLQAGHGQEALRLWEVEAGRVGLLLTDVVMPEGLDGFELAEQLRRNRPGLPVVLMTGYSSELMSRSFELPPGTKFLQKPFSPRDLLNAIRQLLDGLSDLESNHAAAWRPGPGP